MVTRLVRPGKPASATVTSSGAGGQTRLQVVPMLPGEFPGDQDIPRDQFFVIVLAMKLDHFPRNDDPCIRTGKTRTPIGEETWRAKASAL
jgi:hypothetical protein